MVTPCAKEKTEGGLAIKKLAQGHSRQTAELGISLGSNSKPHIPTY